MADSTTSQNFYLSLVEFLLQGKQQVISVSSEYGLTSMQALTLLLTSDDQPRSMNTFCKMYDCDASNITGIVDGLEQKGLVSRQESHKDRRIKIIHLEPAGREIREAVLQKLSGASDYLFGPLTDTEKRQFMDIIEKLAAHNRPTSCPVSK